MASLLEKGTAVILIVITEAPADGKKNLETGHISIFEMACYRILTEHFTIYISKHSFPYVLLLYAY